MDTATIYYERAIYTTGADIAPIRVTVDGTERWMLTIVNFEDDSFKDGDIFNPPESANTLE